MIIPGLGTYEGNFENDLIQGEGKLEFENGWIYKGNFNSN